MPALFADVAETIYYSEDGVQPLTVLKPPAFADGDMLVLLHAQDSGTHADLTAPAGWTQAGATFQVSFLSGKVWRHVWDGTEPSTWDFGYNTASQTAAVLWRVEHADVIAPDVDVPVAVTITSNTASLDSPSATLGGNNDLLLSCIALARSGTLTGTIPASMIDLGGVCENPVGGTSILVAKEQLTSPGTSGTRSWTSISPTGKPAAGISIAIKDKGAFDPDPPRSPQPPIIPPWLLRELLAAKARKFVGDQGSPYVQEAKSGSAGATTVTLTTSDKTVIGDLLVCFHGNNAFTAAGLLAPTGTAGTWALGATGDGDSGNSHIKMWTRPVTVDGVQTVTVAPVLDEENWQHLFVLKAPGGQAVTVDVAAGSSGTASASHVAPSVTVTAGITNALLMCGVQSQTINVTYTPPVDGAGSGRPSMLELTDNNTSGFGAGSVAASVLGAAGATGTRTFTASNAGNLFATITAAFKAGAAPANNDAFITQTDDSGLTDSAILDRTLVLTDSAGLTDSAALDQTLVVTDSAGLTDTTLIEPLKLIIQTDSVGLTDSVALDRALVLTDSAGLTDNALLSRTLAQTDSAGLTDSAVLDRALIQTDSAGLTDAAIVGLAIPITATDNAGLTDTAAIDRSNVVTDSAGLTDTSAITQSKVITDSAGLTDTSALELAKVVSQTDSAGLTDSSVLDRFRVVTDSAGLTDTNELTQSKAITDSAGLTDSSAIQLVKLVTATDSAGLTDNVLFSQTKTVTDSAGLTDTQVYQSAKVITDSAGLTDSLAASFERALTDSAGLTDSRTLALVLGRTVNDSAGLTDTLTTTSLIGRTLTDSAGLTDEAAAGLDSLPATLLASPSGVVDIRHRSGAVDFVIGTVDIHQSTGHGDTTPAAGSVDIAPSGN